MNYHTITHDDMLNGEGLRVVLWLSGCSHKCKGCHNPETWDPNGGIKFDDDAKQEIFDELSKKYISGITFTGGDPFYKDNISEVRELISEIKNKFPNKTIWLYTGYTINELLDNKIDVSNIDVLIDGEFQIDKSEYNENLHWVGSYNQRVIDIKKCNLKSHIIELYK